MPVDLCLSTWYNGAEGGLALPEKPELGDAPHPQVAIQELGIKYQSFEPKAVFDCWYFYGCENVPDDLPPWLLKTDTANKEPDD